MESERRLLVRGFPHWLRASEKASLLQHFGATEVVATPTRGKLRNCAFATFGSHEEARRALMKLHQLPVLQSRLVVEYVQSKHSHLLTDLTHSGAEGEAEDGDDISLSPKPAASQLPSPPPLPQLCYHYPPPSPSTLTNITHALATVPKFYEQVLHLMNLMNLPPPFGAVISDPGAVVRVTEGERKSESEGESEIGSDGEGRRPERGVRQVKRRAANMGPSRGLSPSAKRRTSSSQPQFDSATPPLVGAAGRKISLNLPSKIEPHPPDPSNVISIATISDTEPLSKPTSPPRGEEEEEEGAGPEEEEEEGAGPEEERGEEGEEREFISSEKLSRNRLSESEMREVGVFRGYSRGEPSLRLYIKNLSRQTTEQDLKYVYGRYIDWSSERERTAFDVRLMQAGRMKGQAFVGLPSEEVATAALKETNGYQLAGRPMVVHFARTAKAKPNQ